jgi:hypothetical protein
MRPSMTRLAAALAIPATVCLLYAASARAQFGIESFTAPAENGDGTAAVQAGSHPYAFTTNLNFSASMVDGQATLNGDVRDVHVVLPPGLIGNPTVIAQCTQTQFETFPPGNGPTTECPNSSAIGTASIRVIEGGAEKTPITVVVPVFNLAPPPGVPAEFGFNFANVPVPLAPHVRVDGSYGLTVDSIDTAQAVPVFGTKVTIWGVPYDAGHDRERGTCLGTMGQSLGSCPTTGTPKAYLTLPESCGGPFVTKLDADSWQESASYLADGEPDLANPFWASAEALAPGLQGCNRVPFSPTIAAQPTTDQTTAPTGLNFDLDVADEGLTNPEGVAQSEIRKAVVALPEGFTVNPSAGAGLGACSEAQYEAESIDSPPGAGCPESAKLGDVEIQSPLTEQTIGGAVYLARQDENPFHSLLALYIVAKNPAIGVIIKSAGKIEANPVTGQLTTTFDNLPQLPFSHFRLSFHQGQTSPLVSPPACGAYTATADLTPWSNPEATLHDSASFQITGGLDGGPCPSGGVLPFAPQVLGGTLDDNAGAYSPFDLRITRGDGEQEITGFSSQLPPGLTANLTGVPFCSEADIALARTRSGAQEEAEPSCPAASQIGHTLVGVGVGSVLAYAPGRLYMGGPFEGAPFSIVAITSSTVGPFDLGTVVVHLPLHLDPQTAAVSVAAGGADQIPHIIDGIVVHVREIRVYVDRPSFILNPTSCSPSSLSATVIGAGKSFASAADDVAVTATDPFQAADCQALKFKPTFKAATAARPSRLDGTSLSVKLTYPNAPQGTQANIRSVKVELPKQLSSRLSTLQKACTAAQFAANPAGCPAASVVGRARALTPILPVPLEGPAYFVSHGGEAFPSLVVVLQGYGVTIDLVGSTFISHAGITSSTFKTVPDEPVTSFELTLPKGPYSALTAVLPAKAKGSVCGQQLKMPTTFTAQNGLVMQQSTPIVVTGCAKHEARTRRAARHKRQAGGRKRRSPRA